MTQLFVVGHEFKCRQRKGKKDRRAFFFYIQIRKTILLPLTHRHVIRLSGFFPFLVLFSSPFTLKTTKFCFFVRKNGKKTLSFSFNPLTRKEKDLRRFQKLRSFEIIWSLLRSSSAMFRFGTYL